jgi:MinD-like ATPase involved in chromosome partitioning or flagellar assembly
VSPQRMKVVLMRDDTADDMTPKHVSDALGMPVFWKVPNDYQAVISSINTGHPVVLGSPRSKMARSMRQLSDKISHHKPGAAHHARRGFSLKRLMWNPKESTPGA